ncbi:50S ribosomal protein L7Ae [Candidatus Woesearchaeota archaeon]|nr:50S ribosomal protein L7Ae [Candidatus Woesearchaeota archaeon]
MAEVTKEIQDKAYEAIELARKSGKIKKGTNEVTKIIERGNAKLVVVAKNVNPKEVIMHLEPLCKEKDVPYVLVENKEDLGAAAGLPVGSSAVAVVKEGDALNIIKEIRIKLSK